MKPAPLVLPTFWNNEEDAFAFKNFLAYFQTSVDSHPKISPKINLYIFIVPWKDALSHQLKRLPYQLQIMPLQWNS
jgi:hypothetical protein